jgi:protoheme IX farnesyltransferase
MNQPMTAQALAPQDQVAALRRIWGIYMELSKARLSLQVVITTAVGFVLGSGVAIDWAGFCWTIFGTSLSAAAAGIFNQVIEIRRDGKMPRTKTRPLPSGRIGMPHAIVLGFACGALGLVTLWYYVNPLTAMLSALTLGLYLGVYTPLKVMSTTNTLVGSVVGAIPPMMGWVAASGRFDLGAWLLAALLFVWQIPHFLALAWMYRKDYAMGGYRMLPAIDPEGRFTFRAVVIWSLALMPVTLAFTYFNVLSLWFGAVSIVLGGWLLTKAVRLNRTHEDAEARRTFLATITYLPLLMGLMVICRLPNYDPASAGTPEFLAPTAITAPAEVNGAEVSAVTPSL